MTREEFFEYISQQQIETSSVHFENSVADGYYVLQNHHRWEVSFRERGTDFECVGFPSESDALIYLLNRLFPCSTYRVRL